MAFAKYARIKLKDQNDKNDFFFQGGTDERH